jgi:hypothetical protein
MSWVCTSRGESKKYVQDFNFQAQEFGKHKWDCNIEAHIKKLFYEIMNYGECLNKTISDDLKWMMATLRKNVNFNNTKRPPFSLG